MMTSADSCETGLINPFFSSVCRRVCISTYVIRNYFVFITLDLTRPLDAFAVERDGVLTWFGSRLDLYSIWPRRIYGFLNNEVRTFTRNIVVHHKFIPGKFPLIQFEQKSLQQRTVTINNPKPLIYDETCT